MQTTTLRCRKLSSTEKKPKLKRRQQNAWIKKPTEQQENREKKYAQKRKHRNNALKPTNKLQKPQRPGINLTNLTRTIDKNVLMCWGVDVLKHRNISSQKKTSTPEHFNT